MELPEQSLLLPIYGIAVRIRAADERIRQGLDDRDFFGIHYPVRGQEVISATFGALLRQGDNLVSNYRMMGDAIALGIEPTSIYAEAMGRASGLSSGKGGAMHLAAPGRGLLATTGIVGGGLPIAVGAALGSMLKGEGSLAVVTFGDGATSIGAFHESMSVATAWKLPILFACINNHYLLHTRLERVAAMTELASKAAGYGMDGNRQAMADPIGTISAIKAALEGIPAGDDPKFLEIWGHRRHPHMHGSDASNMDPGCLGKNDPQDPVSALRACLVNGHQCQLEEIESAAIEEMNYAYRSAYGSPSPVPESCMTGLFAHPMEWPK
jgi:TPP-dependent pyruvate/acetoin dehydrogenase alpha subunit